MTLESESDASVSLDNLCTISGNLPATAFGSLIAAEATISMTDGAMPYIHEQLTLTGKGIAQEVKQTIIFFITNIKYYYSSVSLDRS